MTRDGKKKDGARASSDAHFPALKYYLMENDYEADRLDAKTDVNRVREQALWAGLRPGMRVADIGCGIGKTTSVLNEIVQPGGAVVGVDFSEPRMADAQAAYHSPTIRYETRDVRDDLHGLGQFDFIWVRFFLEYFRQESFDIVKNLTGLLRKGGILCLIDLDCNCMNFHGASPRLEKALKKVLQSLQEKGNFDPFVGRKLYSYLFDLGYRDIAVDVSSHHLTYGELDRRNALNWVTKIETIAGKGFIDFSEFGGRARFDQEIREFLDDPRRFIYSPLIMCRGVRNS